MARWRKLVSVSVLSLVCAGSLVAAVACGGGDPKAKEYSVAYAAGASDATGGVPTEYYLEGAPVVLRDCDTFEREGYAFTQWSDGTTLYNAGETYFMPAKDVTFTAQWEVLTPQEAPEDAERVAEIPTGSLITQNGRAKANWFASYTAEGFKLTAWVTDTYVYTDGNVYTNDSVEVVFATVVRSVSHTAKTISVTVAADGETLVKNTLSGESVAVSGLATAAKILTIDGETVAGYRVEITMPYEAAGISQSGKDAAVALGITNASNAGDSKLVYETSLGTELDRLNTFLAVTDDDTFAANPYLELGMFWGNGGTLTAKPSWSLEYDDGTPDAYIRMTGLDGDNNVYMRSTNLSEYYAEVQLHADELCNQEKLAKFGLSVFKTDGTGFLYFVEAHAADGVHFDATSTNLGYVMYSGGAWQWPETMIGNLGEGVTSDAYAGEGNSITLGIYRYNNNFQFYVGNRALSVLTLDNYTQASYAGLVSFNVKLTAKGYAVQKEGLEAYRKTLEDTLGAQPEPEEPTTSSKTIDGNLSDWTASDKNNPFVLPAADGKAVTVYATKDENGVYVFYDVHHAQHKSTENDWFLNTNAEFYLGGSTKQYYVAANGAFGGVSAGNYYMHTEEEAGGYHTVAEIFIPYSDLAGYSASSASVPARFLFKVGGYNGNMWFTGDWWRTDENNTSQGILITDKGILAGSEKTIDGNDDDWSGATFTTSGRSQWAAHLGDDGLYLLVKLTGTISNDRAFFNGADGTDNNWWLNQNIEIQDSTGLKAAKIVYLNGETYYTAYVNAAAAKYTAGTGNADDTLVFEFFIARANFKNPSTKELVATIGGQMFADETSTENVWQTYLNGVTLGVEKYTVIYAYNNGSANTTATVFKGDALSALPSPEREGFTFDGWYEGTVKVTAPYLPAGNVTLTAKWNPVAPTLGWSNGNAAAEGNDPTVSPVWNEPKEVYTLTLPATSPYTLEGHTFSKWSVSYAGVSGAEQYDLGETIEIPAGSTLTVTAVWVTEGATTFTVTFALGYNGAPAYNETRTVEEGEAVSVFPTTPDRTGYRFDGWYLANGNEFTTETTVDGNITVTAKWVQQVTVTFTVGYQGGDAPAAIKADIDTTIELPTPTARKYFSFDGWYLANGTKLTAQTEITEDLTATAKWIHEGETDLDYLFLGASTISTGYWYTYGAQFNSLKAANLAVAGTRVEYWVDKLISDDVLQYNAENIILHIGLNNVNDANESDTTLIGRLTELFAGLKEIYPQAKIYYVSIIPNVAFKNNEPTYISVNKWAKGQEGIDFIDVAQYITKDANGTPEMQWFATDGLHPSVDGYTVFHREIVNALGLPYITEGNGLGDTLVAGAPAYGHTAGWQYNAETGIWHNEDVGKAGVHKLMLTEAYADTLYAEAKVSVAGMYQGETGGKGGLAISSPTVTYFFYINLSQAANSDGIYDDNYGSIAYRLEKQNGKEWVYPESISFRPFSGNGYVHLGAGDYDYNTNPNAYKTLGVAKVGSKLYFYSGGALVGMVTDSLFAADEKVTVSVFNFNTNMYAKDGVVSTDRTQIEAKLPAAHEKTIDGSLSDWSAADKTNPVYIPATNGRSVTVYATMGSDGVYVYYDVYHTEHVTNNSEWHLNTNIEFRLGNGNTQFYQAINGMKNGIAIGDSFMKTVQEGNMYHTVAEVFIPYTHGSLAEYSAESEYVPAGFAFKVDGQDGAAWATGTWWYVPEADPNMKNFMITHNGIKTGTEKTIDGSAEDWASETFTAVGNSRYSAFLGSDGLYFLLEVHAAEIKIDTVKTAGNWYLNTNLELGATDNVRAARIMTFNGRLCYTGYITAAEMSYVQGETEDVWTVEVFIANENLINVTADTQSLSLKMGSQIINYNGANAFTGWAWDTPATVTRKG